MTRNLLLTLALISTSACYADIDTKFQLKFKNFCPEKIESEATLYKMKIGRSYQSIVVKLSGDLAEETSSCTYNGKMTFRNFTNKDLKITPVTTPVVFEVLSPENFTNPAELTYVYKGEVSDSSPVNYTRPSEFKMRIPKGPQMAKAGKFSVSTSPDIEVSVISGLAPGNNIVAAYNQIKNTANLSQTFLQMDKNCIGTTHINCPSGGTRPTSAVVQGFAISQSALDYAKTEFAHAAAESEAKKK